MDLKEEKKLFESDQKLTIKNKLVDFEMFASINVFDSVTSKRSRCYFVVFLEDSKFAEMFQRFERKKLR